MSVVTALRARREARPGPLPRLVLDPLGRPKTAVRWTISAGAIAAFAVAFALNANRPQVRHAAAPARVAHTAILSRPDGAVPALGSLHRLARLPALAPVRHRRHRAAHHGATPVPTAVATATPVATPAATVVPVATARPRPRSTPSPIFDSSG